LITRLVCKNVKAVSISAALFPKMHLMKF
jgi:hypothetical protein